MLLSLILAEKIVEADKLSKEKAEKKRYLAAKRREMIMKHSEKMAKELEELRTIDITDQVSSTALFSL